MAIANKISTTAMSTNRAKVCIYLPPFHCTLSPLTLDLPFDIGEASEAGQRRRARGLVSMSANDPKRTYSEFYGLEDG